MQDKFMTIIIKAEFGAGAKESAQNFQNALNHFTKQGWEFVQIVPGGDVSVHEHILLFKRPD